MTCLHGNVLKAQKGERNLSGSFCTSRLYEDFTPESIRQRHCCTSNYLIKESHTPCAWVGAEGE